MNFLLASTFNDSLLKLTGDEQKAVKTTAFDLQLNPASPGMNSPAITPVGCLWALASKSANDTIFLAPLALLRSLKGNTRAVPLVCKENAHKGRVFFCPDFEEHWEGH